MAKFWVGAPPEMCDLCELKIVDAFVDGRTRMGPWANMCLACHARDGVGLGTGQGQKYERQPDGSWEKTGG